MKFKNLKLFLLCLVNLYIYSKEDVIPENYNYVWGNPVMWGENVPEKVRQGFYDPLVIKCQSMYLRYNETMAVWLGPETLSLCHGNSRDISPQAYLVKTLTYPEFIQHFKEHNIDAGLKPLDKWFTYNTTKRMCECIDYSGTTYFLTSNSSQITCKERRNPHPNDCKLFLTCDPDMGQSTYTCQGETIFNGESCVSRSQVDCSSSLKSCFFSIWSEWLLKYNVFNGTYKYIRERQCYYFETRNHCKYCIGSVIEEQSPKESSECQGGVWSTWSDWTNESFNKKLTNKRERMRSCVNSSFEEETPPVVQIETQSIILDSQEQKDEVNKSLPLVGGLLGGAAVFFIISGAGLYYFASKNQKKITLPPDFFVDRSKSQTYSSPDVTFDKNMYISQ
jgi:hypothetical protein